MSDRPRWIGGATAWPRRPRSSWRWSASRWRPSRAAAHRRRWIENYPNARGNVANVTRLHCDVRHERGRARHGDGGASCGRRWIAIAARRRVAIEVDPYATFGPVAFDPALGDLLRDKAPARQLSTRDMIAAAGHDSVLMAPLCPSAMLFVPSVGGITHNPREYSTKEQLARGAQVLLDAVLELAG